MSPKIHKHHHVTHHHHHEEGIHKVILDEIDEEKDVYLGDQKPSRFNKIFLIGTGIFMIVLTLSYFLLGPHTFDIIASISASEQINELIISGENIDVTFSEEAYTNLTNIYLENQEHEFKACLLGTIEGKTYAVDTILTPDTYQQSYANVRSAGCPKEAIVSMHSHPFKRCIASAQDFKSLEAFRELNPDAAMMVMCELNRFYLYK